MSTSPQDNLRLDRRQMQRLASFIGAEVGIQLPESKHTLVEGRLRQRVSKLGFSCFKDYVDFALDESGGREERLHLIDAITTNKTEFFREPDHFQYINHTALPVMEQNRIRDRRAKLHLWCAGCSTGEEPYTLSMVLNEAAANIPGLKFDILATDISRKCLQIADRGIYTEEHISAVPIDLRKKYFLRSRNAADGLVRMGPELKRNLEFGVQNLMESNFVLQHRMDAIFCRNVMIYFNKQAREEIVNRFESNLVRDGFLFIGHSESLNGIKSRFRHVAPMIYQKV